MISSKYVQEAVRNCEQTLKDTYGGTYNFPKSAPNPLPMGYRPQKYVYEPLSPELASYYQYLIGIMRWMVEIRRIAISTET